WADTIFSLYVKPFSRPVSRFVMMLLTVLVIARSFFLVPRGLIIILSSWITTTTGILLMFFFRVPCFPLTIIVSSRTSAFIVSGICISAMISCLEDVANQNSSDPLISGLVVRHYTRTGRYQKQSHIISGKKSSLPI